jgi:hypothetical protein
MVCHAQSHPVLIIFSTQSVEHFGVLINSVVFILMSACLCINTIAFFFLIKLPF